MYAILFEQGKRMKKSKSKETPELLKPYDSLGHLSFFIESYYK